MQTRNWQDEILEERELTKKEVKNPKELGQAIQIELAKDEVKEIRIFKKSGENRNKLCPCGSGKKFKKCCEGK